MWQLHALRATRKKTVIGRRRKIPDYYAIPKTVFEPLLRLRQIRVSIAIQIAYGYWIWKGGRCRNLLVAAKEPAAITSTAAGIAIYETLSERSISKPPIGLCHPPSKSPMALLNMERNLLAKFYFAAKRTLHQYFRLLPVLRNTETVAEPKISHRKSGLPSPSKSLRTTENLERNLLQNLLCRKRTCTLKLPLVTCIA